MKAPILNLVINPIAALLITHFYELGFAIYFGIHPKFITISFSTVYYFCLILFGCVIVYLIIRAVLFKFTKKMKHLFSWLEKRSIYFISTVLLISVLGAYLWGLHEGVTRKLFLIRETTPEQVVLVIYGDKLITAPFDRQRKEVRYGYYYITKMGDEPNIMIKYDIVGPLKPVR